MSMSMTCLRSAPPDMGYYLLWAAGPSGGSFPLCFHPWQVLLSSQMTAFLKDVWLRVQLRECMEWRSLHHCKSFENKGCKCAPLEQQKEEASVWESLVTAVSVQANASLQDVGKQGICSWTPGHVAPNMPKG